MRHVPAYKRMRLYPSPFVKLTKAKKRLNSHIGACAYKRGNMVYSPPDIREGIAWYFVLRGSDGTINKNATRLIVDH